MGGDGSFEKSLSNWLLTQFPVNLPKVLLFLPTARTAAQVRACLSLDYTGVLPTIMPLVGSDALADLLGLETAVSVRPGAARLEIFRVVQAIEGRQGGGTSAVAAARVWRQVEGLYQVLNRFGLHGVGMGDIRRTTPDNLVGAWELQAETLLKVAGHMEGWLAARGEVLAGTRERMILERAAEALEEGVDGWVPVVAGVVDALPAGMKLARVAAERGAVVVPKVEGEVSGVLAAQFAEIVGAEVVTLRVEGESDVWEVVTETDWDEARVAALAVKRALAQGQTKVAVVSPSLMLRRRVGAMVESLGIAVGCCTTLERTAAGRWALGVAWLEGGKPADFLDAMGCEEDCRELMAALGDLVEEDVWLRAEDWKALMGLTLADAEVREEAAEVVLLGPREARLAVFETVILVGVIEGVWPAFHPDTWLCEAQLRALGMPDNERRALLAGAELESLVSGGSANVLVVRPKTVGGKEVVASRFLTPYRERLQADEELPAALEMMREDKTERIEQLGVFVPEGEMWPARWSASLVEDMLACPYKAMARRMLGLHELDPLLPQPDARQAGLLVHRWLERAGREIAEVTAENLENVVDRLKAFASLELRKESAVMRAIWRAKFAKLAPALASRWLAEGRKVAAVERKVSAEVGAVMFTAKIDRIEDVRVSGSQDLRRTVVDFKTGTPPTMAKVASGERPQLALEAWLLGLAGETVSEVEFWHLRGYGTTPLSVVGSGGKYPLEILLAPVGDGVTQLVEAFGEGKAWPAVPHLAGGGLLATGHCERCDLAGVCRRKAGMVTA